MTLRAEAFAPDSQARVDDRKTGKCSHPGPADCRAHSFDSGDNLPDCLPYSD